jgi:hypothetical protein
MVTENPETQKKKVNELKNLKTPEFARKEKNKLLKGKKTIINEISGYSAVFDALFLLVLISLAGVLLMPSMQAEKQYTATGYVTASELDNYLLGSLLSCKLEDFEYEISPVSALNIFIPEDSVADNTYDTLFGKEEKHRTFVDLITEYLALSLIVSNNNSSIHLNPLAAEYSSHNLEAISAYLDQKTAGRLSYRLEAYWHPVEAFPIGSELIVGKEPPADAIRQSAKLSMPLYAGAPSKDVLLACINDSVLEASFNSSNENISKPLAQAFNSSLDAAAQEGAETVIELIFPSDYSGSVFGEEKDESFQTLFYGVSENSFDEKSDSTEKAFEVYFSNLLKAGFPMDSINSENSSNESNGSNGSSGNSPVVDLTLFKSILQDHVKAEIRTELEARFSGEINETVSSILKAQNLSEAQTLRNERIDSIYRQINPGGARIVLSLWNPSA